MDIVEFLTARLDEDEESARDLLRGHPGPWRVDEPSSVRDSGGQVVVADEYHWTPMQYIAYWDPARVLADIAAKRAVIHLYRQTRGLASSLGENAEWESRVWLLEGVLARLAAPYAEHPDFDPAWAIDGI